VAEHDPAGARIGPNVIIRLGEALEARLGRAVRDDIFAAADLSEYLRTEPTAMVPEADVVALNRSLRGHLATDTADAIVRDAGERTAGYLLAHRIPPLAQRLLSVLPASLAARLLLALICRHAWTFAGSAGVTLHGGRRRRVVFEGSPLARGVVSATPVCGFYAGTFEGLFRALVAPNAQVREVTCAATGASSCTLELSW